MTRLSLMLHIVLITMVGAVAMAPALRAQSSNNTVFGSGAGGKLDQVTSNAHNNTLIGENAGAGITLADQNTLVGKDAGLNSDGSFNTMIGYEVGQATTTGKLNAFFGDGTGFSSITGSSNTYFGGDAGSSNQTGSRNVFVGDSAGRNELGSHKLYFDNTFGFAASYAPLIYGEFNMASEGTNGLVGINGALGVGTQIALDTLHVRDGNLRIEQTGANAILNFVANGHTWEITNNSVTGRLIFFSPGGGATTSPFKFDRQATENLFRVGVMAASTVDINGDLVVTGSINPDYVFTPEYPLETIEAHGAYMWEHGHLPAVGPGQVNAQGQGMVNVGVRSQGMLEELEKLHIYIEQLHVEMAQNEAQLEALREARTVKEVQLNALKSEMTALEALVQQLMVRDRDQAPGEES